MPDPYQPAGQLRRCHPLEISLQKRRQLVLDRVGTHAQPRKTGAIIAPSKGFAEKTGAGRSETVLIVGVRLGHRIQQVLPLLVFRVVEHPLNLFVAQRLHDWPDRFQLSIGPSLCLYRINRLRSLLWWGVGGRGRGALGGVPSRFVGFFLLIVGIHRVPSEYRGDDLPQAALHVGVVRDRPDDRCLARRLGPDPALDQLARVDQQSGADSFFQPMVFEIADLLPDRDQAHGDLLVHTGFALDDAGFQIPRGIRELDRYEALLGALLEVLQHTLVARVVRDDQQEIIHRLDHLSLLLDRQQTPVVAQGMDDHGRVLAGLDDLVQVHDRAVLDPQGQRAVHPDSLIAFEQEAPDQIGDVEGRVAGHADQGTPQLLGHVLDEPGLPAAGWAFQHHRHSRCGGRLEQPDLAIYLGVERLRFYPVLLVSLLPTL